MEGALAGALMFPASPNAPLARSFKVGFHPMASWIAAMQRLVRSQDSLSCSSHLLMFKSFKRLAAPILFTALLGLIGLGCRTANGFGQDMEKAGESIQDGTR